jgi:hypothetical protein
VAFADILHHSHCHRKRRDELTDLFILKPTPHLLQYFRHVLFQAIVAQTRGTDAVSPIFSDSGRWGHRYCCPTGLCVRAHEEVQFKLKSRRNTLTMTSLVAIVKVDLTGVDIRLLARRELSDRSFYVTSTHILNYKATEGQSNSPVFEDDQFMLETCWGFVNALCNRCL